MDKSKRILEKRQSRIFRSFSNMSLMIWNVICFTSFCILLLETFSNIPILFSVNLNIVNSIVIFASLCVFCIYITLFELGIFNASINGFRNIALVIIVQVFAFVVRFYSLALTNNTQAAVSFNNFIQLQLIFVTLTFILFLISLLMGWIERRRGRIA